MEPSWKSQLERLRHLVTSRFRWVRGLLLARQHFVSSSLVSQEQHFAACVGSLESRRLCVTAFLIPSLVLFSSTLYSTTWQHSGSFITSDSSTCVIWQSTTWYAIRPSRVAWHERPDDGRICDRLWNLRNSLVRNSEVGETVQFVPIFVFLSISPCVRDAVSMIAVTLTMMSSIIITTTTATLSSSLPPHQYQNLTTTTSSCRVVAVIWARARACAQTLRLPMSKRKAVGADTSAACQPAAPDAKQSRALRQAVEADISNTSQPA